MSVLHDFCALMALLNPLERTGLVSLLVVSAVCHVLVLEGIGRLDHRYGLSEWLLKVLRR